MKLQLLQMELLQIGAFLKSIKTLMVMQGKIFVIVQLIKGQKKDIYIYIYIYIYISYQMLPTSLKLVHIHLMETKHVTCGMQVKICYGSTYHKFIVWI